MRSGASSVQNETLVRFGNASWRLDQRAELGEVERLELLAVGDPDRRLRVADREVLEAHAADLAVEAHDRAAHVDAAGALAGDRRCGSRRPRSGSSRCRSSSSRARAGRAAPGGRRCRTARPPSRRGCRSAGGRRSRARRRARARARRRRRRRGGGRTARARASGSTPGRLDDQVVVAQRLPLLELHGSDHAVQLGGDVVRVAAGDVERADVGQLAHPRELALGVAAGAGLHRLDVAREQLLEAERLAGGGRGAGCGRASTSSRAPAATIASTRSSIRSASAVAVHHQAGQQRRVAGVGGPQLASPPRAARSAGVEQLERAHEPLAVGGRDAGGDRGRAAGQLGVQRLRRRAPRSSPCQRARTSGDRRAQVELGQRGAQVQAGAADDDRPPARRRARRRSPRARSAA